MLMYDQHLYKSLATDIELYPQLLKIVSTLTEGAFFDFVGNAGYKHCWRDHGLDPKSWILDHG